MKKIDKTQLIESYTADSQTALSDVDHLYKRPALTFGGERSDESYPFSSQKTVAIREILDNAIGEIEVGVADRVRVTFFLDGSVEILDNGRGMPVDNSVDAYGEEINGLYKSMGLLKSGQSLGDVKKGKFVSSLNGVGGSSTQYFSEYFKIEVYRKNRIYRLDFKDGVNGLFEDNEFKPYKNKVKLDKQMDRRDPVEKKLYPHGTRLTFKLNDERFASQYPVDVEDIKLRIKRASFLFPKATFIIRQETDDGFVEKEYYSENGLVDLVNLQLNNSITSPILFSNKLGFRVRGKDNGKIDSRLTGEQLYKAIQKEYKDGDALSNERELIYEFAFGYNSDYSTSIDSFANSIRNTLGGVHVEAFEKALVKTFNDKFHSMNNGLPKNGPDVILRDIEEGLVAAISIKTNEPEFNGQEKQLLSSKDLQKALQKDLEDQLEKWLNRQSNRETLEIIAKKVIQAMKNRSKAQAQIELNREKNKIMKSNSLPTSLVDCEYTNSPISELYLCEGLSALSGLKTVRDSRFQSLLPVKGKILNVRKASAKEILQNQEIQDIIKSLGCGIGEECLVENGRYQNIIIATDSDVDGSAISNLMITLVWELFPDYIRKGKLFRMLSPLYEIVADKSYYCLTNDEKKSITNDLTNRGIKIKETRRFKGLGETGAKVLKETGIDPKTRTLLQIKLEDVQKAEEMIELISGDSSDARKSWIMENEYIPEIVEVND